MINFSTLILLLDFSMYTNPSGVIFYSIDSSWSVLSKHTNFHLNSLSDLIKLEEHLENFLHDYNDQFFTAPVN